jgi:amino acid adenylation domain-containing protein
MQQGMVFHSLYASHSGVEIEQMVYTLPEALEVTALIAAWQRVVNRHAIMRTSFHWDENDEPVQQVQRAVNLEWHREDWRGLSPSEQDQRLNKFLKDDRLRGFNINESPLSRFALFQRGQSDYEFVWTFHHAIIDGHSFVLVLQEVFAFYEAFSKGEELALPLPRPYRDYIAWLHEQDFSQAKRFWQTLLKGFASPTPLIGSRQTSRVFTEVENYNEQGIRFSSETTAKLKDLAKAHGVTLNNFVQGAWALLLSRYSGEVEIIFGATRACRRTALEGAEWMVGPFINTLPMRVRVAADRALMDWLREIRNQHVRVREYEHTPLAKIQEWSEVPGGQSLFDSILVFENYEMEAYLRTQGKSWADRQFKLFEQTNYPLTLSGWGGATLLLKIAYDERNFDDNTISRMLGHLGTLLEKFAANPQARLGWFSMLTPTEQDQLLVEWNDTKADDRGQLCIHQLFESQVERSPEDLAVMSEDEQLTYDELNRRANQVAHYLKAGGIQSEELVGVSMARSPEMMVAILGVLKAGAAYVPLDPTYPKERLATMLEDANPSVLLTQQRLLKNLPPSKAQVICMDSDWQQIAHASTKNPQTEVTPKNLAYVIYTSGSTGKPKGVMIEHRSLVNFTAGASREYHIKPGDRLLQFASLSFDASAEEIYPCLTSGATLVLRNEPMLTSISSFLEKCQAWEITILDLPTAYWHELTEYLATTGTALPPSVRLVIIGGERVLPQRLEMWHKTVGQQVRLVNTYGPTEATIVATTCDITSPVNQSLLEAPIGRPIQNTEIYLLDSELQPVPVGITGQLHIGGLGLARGYLHHPELTAESFIANPFSKQENSRLYKTGDLARFLPDGQIVFCGRADHQVKIHGFRIEPGEIESAILNHPMVQDVIVLAREELPGEKRLVAYLVPQPEHPTSQAKLEDGVREFLSSRLPAYLVPSAYVMLDALPINPSGKLDHQALPVPDLSKKSVGSAYVKPQNPLQYQLVQIWEELFDYRPIGIRDNFFELGGHSLLSVRLMGRLEQTFGKRLQLATLFAGATIEHLAEALFKQETEAQRSPLIAVQPDGSRPPFFYLHGDFQGGGMYCLNLARQLGNEQPFYAIQPHGLESQVIPGTIEEMAEDHLKSLRAFQPRGPYQLGGHCNGGLLAFEMARQLEARGEKVNLLVLIATAGANTRYRVLHDVVNHYCSLQGIQPEQQQQMFLKLRALAIRLGEIRRYYAGRFKDIEQFTPLERLAFVRKKGAGFLKSLAEIGAQASGSSEPQMAKPSANPAFQFVENPSSAAHQIYEQAMTSYVPRQYSGRVTLFWPSEWATQAVGDATVGWRNVAPTVDVHIVPGGHLTCLINQVGDLAKQLKLCLEQSQATR